jgi:hypothetical protein
MLEVLAFIWMFFYLMCQLLDEKRGPTVEESDE